MNVLEILLGIFDQGYFPPPKDVTSTPRYHVHYRSPRFGTCDPRGCCDICDGLKISPETYTLDEARAIQRNIVARDSMALTSLRARR